MRILFSCAPVLGHFLPMTPLIDAALRAGHEVAVASGSDLEVEVKRLGAEFWQAGQSVAELMAMHQPDAMADAPPEEREAQMGTDIESVFIPLGRRKARDLVARAVDWRPDLVVHEMTDLAGGIAATVTGARAAVHALSPSPAVVWSMFLPAYASLCDEWQIVNQYLAADYIDMAPAALRQEPPGFARILPVRPAPPPSPADNATLLLPREHPETVYLTLGTVFHDATDVFRAALEGLSMLPVNTFVTTGPGLDPARVGEWPAHIHVTDFVPQELVLPHCQVAIHHGGSGSMIGALRHGLPQLVLPRGADNFHNAQLAQAAGVALTLTPEEVSSQAIADAVTLLLTEPGFTATARTIGADIAAMPSPDQVLLQLQTQTVA
jgi:UDP:flavonoid glycosyltransferase YjiC (YdhE family)